MFKRRIIFVLIPALLTIAAMALPQHQARAATAANPEAFIDSLVAPGHPSTPGFNDPLYPLHGRVPRSGAAPSRPG